MVTLYPTLEENSTAHVRQGRRLRSTIFRQTRDSNVTYVEVELRSFPRLEKNRECGEL